MVSGAGGADRRRTWARHAAATDLLREVLSALDAARIEALPVKGILTAHLLYHDVAERPIRDIDLRIPRKHFRRLLRVARECRWDQDLTGPRLWEVVLHRPAWPFTVDVECAIGVPGQCALSVANLIARATRCSAPFGFDHLQPDLNDHALLLTLNAFKDALEVAPWALADLLLIANQPGFDPQKYVARAIEGRVVAATSLVACWLAREHGSRSWQRVSALLRPLASSARVRACLEIARASSRIGLFTAASASDAGWRALEGLGFAFGGVLCGRVNRLRARRARLPRVPS